MESKRKFDENENKDKDKEKYKKKFYKKIKLAYNIKYADSNKKIDIDKNVDVDKNDVDVDKNDVDVDKNDVDVDKNDVDVDKNDVDVDENDVNENDDIKKSNDKIINNDNDKITNNDKDKITNNDNNDIIDGSYGKDDIKDTDEWINNIIDEMNAMIRDINNEGYDDLIKTHFHSNPLDAIAEIIHKNCDLYHCFQKNIWISLRNVLFKKIRDVIKFYDETKIVSICIDGHLIEYLLQSDSAVQIGIIANAIMLVIYISYLILSYVILSYRISF